MKYECFACHNILYGFIPVTNRRPMRTGDWTVCDCCGSIYRIGESMEFLTVDTDELGQLAADNPNLYKALMVLTDYITKKIKQN